MSSSSLEDLTVLGGQLQAIRYYLIASHALLIYDQILTLGDEARYIWSSKLSLATVLFYINRYYLPVMIPLDLAVGMSDWSEAVCKTVGTWLPFLFLCVPFVPANILLLLRVYAIYNRSKWVLGYLSSFIVIGIALGFFLFTFHGGRPSSMPPTNLPVFRGCILLYTAKGTGDGYVSILVVELVYDLSIFGLIIFNILKNTSIKMLQTRGMIMHIIARDGIMYFFVIFSTMCVWTFMTGFASPTIKQINGRPTIVMMVIMTNRLTINLHQWAKRSTPLMSSSQQPSSSLPTWIINTQAENSSWAEITEESRNDARDSPIVHDGTSGIELPNMTPSI